MLSIIIPTYKEAQNIDVLLPRIDQVLRPQIPDLKVIIVDDNSPDGIEDIVKKHNQHSGGMVRLIVRKDKKGLASAWKDGIAASTTPFVSVMDADLAHSPEDVLRLWNERTDVDMVIGSRYLPHHLVQMKSKSIFATWLSVVGQKIARSILRIGIYDMSHSFRLFKRQVFDQTAAFLECEGNSMMIEFTFHTIRLGFNIKEIPVSYGGRIYGETKLGIIKEGRKFIQTLRKLKENYRNETI